MLASKVKNKLKYFLLLNKNSMVKLKKKELILILLVFLLGITFRLVEVLNKNFLFGFDQGRDYLAVREIVVNKNPTLIGAEAGGGFTGLRGIFHGPYFYYSLILPFLVFEGDPYGGLVLMFIFGVASLFLGFFFVQKNFGIKAALATTLLMGVALSAQSRFMWNPHPATFIILLVFWFVFKIPKNPPKYFFLANFFAGIIYGFQLASSIPLIISLYLFSFLVPKIRDFKTYLFGFLGIILACLPFFLFEIRHGFMAIRGIFGGFSSVGERSFMHFVHLSARHLLSFWFNFRDTFLLSERLAFWFFIVLFFSLVYYLWREKTSKEKNFVCFLLLLPLVTFLVFMFFNNVVWGHYLIHLHLVYILLFALFLTRTKPFFLRMALFLFLILMVPGIVKRAGEAYYDFYDYGGTAKVRGKLDAIDHIYTDAGGEDFNVLVFTPPIYDYAYRYLLSWYGEKKYGYVPGEEKKGIFYLWIEPDPQKPWTYKGWLETVIITGEILKEEKLPSGFIIQKRLSR